MKDIEIYIQKIQDAVTHLPEGHKDSEWIDGFNTGLNWAIRILRKDKSAY